MKFTRMSAETLTNAVSLFSCETAYNTVLAKLIFILKILKLDNRPLHRLSGNVQKEIK